MEREVGSLVGTGWVSGVGGLGLNVGFGLCGFGSAFYFVGFRRF